MRTTGGRAVAATSTRSRPEVLRHPQRGVDFENAQLGTVGPDDADRTDANLTVDPNALGRVLNTEILMRENKKTRTSGESPRIDRADPTRGTAGL